MYIFFKYCISKLLVCSKLISYLKSASVVKKLDRLQLFNNIPHILLNKFRNNWIFEEGVPKLLGITIAGWDKSCQSLKKGEPKLKHTHKGRCKSSEHFAFFYFILLCIWAYREKIQLFLFFSPWLSGAMGYCRGPWACEIRSSRALMRKICMHALRTFWVTFVGVRARPKVVESWGNCGWVNVRL